MGAAKTGGNYASSLVAQQEAIGQGCDQVVFLDAQEGRYVEELGGMNMYFVHDDGTIVTPETAAFQDFLTRYAWGEVWTRPQLTRAQRSIATLASLVTGGHESEFRMHARAALRNGLTRTEIAEVVHHTALYAGLPAANSAMAILREVFAADDDTEESNG